jgi:hypothetical protein
MDRGLSIGFVAFFLKNQGRYGVEAEPGPERGPWSRLTYVARVAVFHEDGGKTDHPRDMLGPSLTTVRERLSDTVSTIGIFLPFFLSFC